MNDVRFVKDGVARALRTLLDCHESRAGRPGGPVVGADDRVAVHGRGASGRRRQPGDRALGAGRAGVGADEPRRVDHRRDARRELEDQPHGGALLRRSDCRAWSRCALPVGARAAPCGREAAGRGAGRPSDLILFVDLQYRRHILCKPESASPRTPLEPDDQPLQFIARAPPRHLVDVAYPRPQTPAATDRGEDKRGRSGSRTWPPGSPPATGRGSAGAESNPRRALLSVGGSTR